jgi:hypothetical protein
MNASYVNHELTTIQTRTRRFTGVSGLFHLLFFLMVFLMRTIAPGPERLVEITWIEPVYNIPTATETTSPPPEKSTVLMSSEDRVKERFVRDKSKADVAPRPQTRKAVEDRINKRLATLQNAKVEKQVQIAAITMPTDVTRPVLAGIHSDESKPGKPGELTRQPAIGTKPVELQRTPVIASKPAPKGRDHTRTGKTDRFHHKSHTCRRVTYGPGGRQAPDFIHDTDLPGMGEERGCGRFVVDIFRGPRRWQDQRKRHSSEDIGI